jgi:hypothetical protein
MWRSAGRAATAPPEKASFFDPDSRFSLTRVDHARMSTEFATYILRLEVF